MHDASHHAISSNKFTNEILASIWNSLALWNTEIWYKHHCVMHHSFTGSKKDPDTIHFNPFIRKSLHERPNKYLKYSNCKAIFFANIFPEYVVWAIYCIFLGIIKKRLWRMQIEYKLKIHELILSSFIIFSFLYSYNIYVIFSYIIGCNITYFICIMPDHDTFETHSNIIYDTKSKDWGNTST